MNEKEKRMHERKNGEVKRERERESKMSEKQLLLHGKSLKTADVSNWHTRVLCIVCICMRVCTHLTMKILPRN